MPNSSFVARKKLVCGGPITSGLVDLAENSAGWEAALGESLLVSQEMPPVAHQSGKFLGCSSLPTGKVGPLSPVSTFCSILKAGCIRDGGRKNDSWLKVNLFSNNFLD